MMHASTLQRIPRDTLASLLAHRIGLERSMQLITESAQRLGLATADYDPEQAAQIFEHLAGSQGALGVAARFAKARLMLLLIS